MSDIDYLNKCYSTAALIARVPEEDMWNRDYRPIPLMRALVNEHLRNLGWKAQQVSMLMKQDIYGSNRYLNKLNNVYKAHPTREEEGLMALWYKAIGDGR